MSTGAHQWGHRVAESLWEWDRAWSQVPSQPRPLGDSRLAPCWTNSFVNSGGSCHSPATEPRWPPGARQARVRFQEGPTQPPCPAHPGGPVLTGERSGELVPVLSYLSQPQPRPTLQWAGTQSSPWRQLSCSCRESGRSRHLEAPRQAERPPNFARMSPVSP